MLSVQKSAIIKSLYIQCLLSDKVSEKAVLKIHCLSSYTTSNCVTIHNDDIAVAGGHLYSLGPMQYVSIAASVM